MSYIGRGRGPGSLSRSQRGESNSNHMVHKRAKVDTENRDFHTLGRLLDSLKGAPYPAYKDIVGNWYDSGYLLTVYHVQADPYAHPSKLKVFVNHEVTRFAPTLYR